MDKISKFIKRLTKKDAARVAELLLRISDQQTGAMDVKKLRGYEKLYRVRDGDIRVVYKEGTGKNLIVDINFRKDIYRK